LNMDKSTSDKPREAAASKKKPYKAPSFRFETAFEVSALACGKLIGLGSSCKGLRKAS
jgi:hypothetical protein